MPRRSYRPNAPPPDRIARNPTRTGASEIDAEPGPDLLVKVALEFARPLRKASSEPRLSVPPRRMEEGAMRHAIVSALSLGLTLAISASARADYTMQAFALPDGAEPHDVYPAPDGTVWYTAQRAGALGRLDPKSGKVALIPLGENSAPHGVIVGPDGAPWITDGGLNAIVRVDPQTQKIDIYKLPPHGKDLANLNTATFDQRGILWFTGQNGVYGVLDPHTGGMQVYDAPKGVGPYGIAATPAGAVFYASLAGSYLGRIDIDTGEAKVIEPPTRDQGARRVWSDSKGGVWVSEWNAGQVARYDSASGAWQGWKLPGAHPQPYAVYVDERDKVWLSDWGANAILRFDPVKQTFETFALPRRDANVRQMAGRKGEVWAAESGTGHLLVIRFE
jgi:virginiamycin B lyase